MASAPENDDTNPQPVSHLTLDFGDGEYDFRLPVGQVGELQEKCRCGIGALYARLMAGRYRDRDGNIVLNPLEAQFYQEDIAETIRLALIGGGGGVVDGKKVEVTPAVALQLVRRYVHDRPLFETWRIASVVLSAHIVGYETPEKKSPQKPAKAKAAAG